nr:unnamed protein product [Hydra vulgaris]
METAVVMLDAGISKSKFNELKEIGIDAAVLTSIDETDFLYSSETDTAEETDETCIPEPLTYLFEPNLKKFSQEALINKGKQQFKLYKKCYTQKSFDRLSKITHAQRFSQCWKEHKCGRITASYFYEACHLLKNGNKSFINKILQYKSFDGTIATKYGTENEGKAREKYFQIMSEQHKNFKITLTGLHVNEKFPEIGASPDAFVECYCHVKGLVEIKCPYKYVNGIFRE